MIDLGDVQKCVQPEVAAPAVKKLQESDYEKLDVFGMPPRPNDAGESFEWRNDLAT